MFLSSSKPSEELLQTAAPLEVWNVAIKQARRSPMTKYKAGAVIWNPGNERVISYGTSHPDQKLANLRTSIHAEHHACRNRYAPELTNSWICVYTLNARNGCSWSSRPCYSCALMLYKREIERVMYPKRVSENTWIIETDFPEGMLENAAAIEGPFARQQRI